MKGLVALFRRATKELEPKERDNADGVLWRWLERLIESAERAGAKAVKKAPKHHLVESSEEDEGPSEKLRLKPTRQPKRPAVIVINSDSEEDGSTPSESTVQPIVVKTICRAPTALSSQTQGSSSLSASSPKLPLVPPASQKRSRATVNSDASDVEKPAQRQRTLFDLGCKRVSKEEAEAQQKRVTAMLGVDTEKLRVENEDRKEMKKEHKRELARIRQQRCRDRKRAAGGSQGCQVKARLLGVDAGRGEVSPSLLADLPELSRPHSTWKQQRNGKKGGVVKEKASRVDWFNPFLFSSIARIAPRVCFSPTMIVRHLQREQPTLYRRLHKSVVARWISKSKKDWSKRTKAKIAAGHTLKGSGRVGVLTPYPEIVDEVKKQLKGLRDSGITIDRLLGRSIFISVIRERQPQILDNFKCSEKYVGHFYESVMEWSLRCGTRPAAKLPDDAMEQIERTFYRVVHLVNLYDIPPELVINMDQTGVILLMSKKRTFAPTNSKQVDISFHDEKRAYTLCVASTPAGDILPFQQVWSGKTANSLPNASAPGYSDALEEGFDFAFADSPKKSSHFSTFKTMREWIKNILKPYIDNFIEINRERLNLQDDQKAILLIDCYPVHIAGCTGIFQPADLVLNRVIKHFLRQEALHFLVESHSKQLKEGLTPEKVQVTTSLPTLRNASVQPVVKLYRYLRSYAGRQLVKRAWEKCAVGEWNLSAECITSRRAKAAYREYLEKDRVLRQEIEAKLGREATVNAQLVPEVEDFNGDAYPLDDSTDIPLSTIVEEVTGELADTSNELIFHNTFCVDSSTVARELDGSFDVTSSTESVWAYTRDGRTWSDALDDVSEA
ncbi:hypothetical protein LshimejAT787_0704620 [Lyophyllum shimeji]|uniref:DDE-1 domain-containing protein n=1 Tax=Lyophyllum shimeji TaxID=47721 RepID=A0A9P3PNZ0_LYOSH|nr:hypothetical protein LshimejAT787_0704620 [Lyophyllum shimeji]